MKLYEMEGFLRGKCLPGDLLIGESNAEYLVRKLNEASTLKAERDAQQKRADALAVENAALKDGFEWLYAVVSSDEVSIPDAKYSAVTNAAAVLSETPATDAALAAIQAQGVEKLIKLKMEQLANMHPDTHAFGATAESLRAQINELQAFATELREGK